MTTLVAITLVAALTACGGKTQTSTAPKPAAARALSIKLTTVFVDDQQKALHFYTDVLGFVKKDDVSNSGYRWLTVTAPEDPEGSQLQLAKNDNPAAKAFQEATFQQGQPATMLFTADVKREYERIKAKGVEFTMPPTAIMGVSIIATLKDTCGNLIQITQPLH